MGSSRQEYWSGLPCPPPGDRPDPGIESTSLISPALAGGFFTTSATWEVPILVFGTIKFKKNGQGLISILPICQYCSLEHPQENKTKIPSTQSLFVRKWKSEMPCYTNTETANYKFCFPWIKIIRLPKKHRYYSKGYIHSCSKHFIS